MKYSQGSYQIIFFGKYGNKIKKKSANNYTQAMQISDKHLDKHPKRSSVINRTIWNSKSKNSNWA